MEIGYWGIGFKHDLLQWIPIADKIPIDLSYLISYLNYLVLLTLTEIEV